MARPSFTTSATAARACRCRGARRRWPPTSRWLNRAHAAVLGSGVVGLTSARELQRHGFDVTIYAATVPPDTTSNMSLAGFTPTSGLVDNQLRTPEWDAQFRQAARDRVSAAAAADRSEVRRHRGSSNTSRPTTIRRPRGGNGMRIRCCRASCRGARIAARPGEHPFPTRYASSAPRCASSRRSTSTR